MASSDGTFETESLIPVSFTPEAIGNPTVSSGTLKQGQHFLLQQSPSSGCPVPHGHAVEMVAVPCGQDEQRSDSGRGASDEEAVFQGSFQPILCGTPAGTNGKGSGSGAMNTEHTGQALPKEKSA